LLTAAGIPVTDLRVRDLGGAARVEVPADDLPFVRAVSGLAEAIGAAGFAGMPVEYAAFSPGNLNKENIDHK
jgi:uncharacterized protein